MKIARKLCPGSGELGYRAAGGLIRCEVCRRYCAAPIGDDTGRTTPRHRPHRGGWTFKLVKLARPRAERIREIFEIEHGDL